ncbi:MAG: Gfo/Idh/MocA family oxidoreductase [Alphaproteobacteria bacterium]|nr:Gfo/Idh/MocA family oxidoreductase [Alphaproteobacteria bacterium]
MSRKSLGVAVIGCGRIGTLRANLASRYPAVNFIALSDAEQHRADILAQQIGANFSTNNNLEAINHPEVNTVIVSTPEHDHREAIIQALEAGKPVLIEKPIALTLEDADAIINASSSTGTEFRVGYSRRHERRWMLAKEQLLQNRLGEVIGIQSRVYNTRAQMLQILERSPKATPVLDVLTYYVDMACWYLEGIQPIEVVARSHGKVFRNLGYEADDVTWAIITFENGAIVNLGICYALPSKYPSIGQSSRFEILGDEGVILLDADNKDSLLYTDNGAPHTYVPDHNINLMFMQTTSAADFAVGDFWGALANESRSWFDHLLTGQQIPHATPEEARLTLKVTLAIEEASRTSQTVVLS